MFVQGLSDCYSYGAENGGNVFPGVVAKPHANVKLGPDMYDGENDEYSGYATAGTLTGFSLMHESGTGGAPKYGTVSQLPVAGSVTNPLTTDYEFPRSVSDTSQVGYYQFSLSTGVVTELAASDHAGMLSYSFPSVASNVAYSNTTSTTGSVIVDVSHVLGDWRGLGWEEYYLDGNITIADDGHYEGSGTYDGGWNIGKLLIKTFQTFFLISLSAAPWTIYFCGYFDSTPSSIKTFIGNGTTLLQYDNTSTQSSSEAARVGAVYSFSSTNVTSRVGISWTSSAKACQFVEDEIPKGTSLQKLVSAAQSIWNTEIFSKVTTKDTSNTTLLGLLYSSLYGAFLIPSNRTGDTPGFADHEYYYDDFFTLWDLFRCSTSLWHIINPTSYTQIISSLINTQQKVGWMPDARSSNFNGKSQGGSNADNVLADAYVKGVQADWEGGGWAALWQDAEVTPPNNDDPVSPDSSTAQGRGALPDWLEYGYVTPTFYRSVSRAIEYSANDFALYQVAKGLGKIEDANKYLSRSRNWRNQYNPEASSLNFTGFIVPKYANGTFVEQDPLSCGGCYWTDYYYEATPWEYLFNPIHDIDHLIQLTGGKEAFVEKLATIFTPGLDTSNSGFDDIIANPGNEPSFLSPYLFNFAGRQDLSVKYSRWIATSFYLFENGGLPGNSDAGAMQTWWLWSFIGLFPVTGQTTFLIGSPWLNDLSINTGSGILHITARGSGDYVQSLKVNGRPWDQSWVTWDDVFARGGTMEFVLGSDPSTWASNGIAPPSPAS